MGIGALRSLVSTHSFASRISCFSALFFDLNSALDLMTTSFKNAPLVKLYTRNRFPRTRSHLWAVS